LFPRLTGSAWSRAIQPTTPDSNDEEILDDTSGKSHDLGLIVGISALIFITFFFLLLVSFFHFLQAY
jgi:hypothetical protein